jgi:hypothetical protein
MKSSPPPNLPLGKGEEQTIARILIAIKSVYFFAKKLTIKHPDNLLNRVK